MADHSSRSSYHRRHRTDSDIVGRFEGRPRLPRRKDSVRKNVVSIYDQCNDGSNSVSSWDHTVRVIHALDRQDSAASIGMSDPTFPHEGRKFAVRVANLDGQETHSVTAAADQGRYEQDAEYSFHDDMGSATSFTYEDLEAPTMLSKIPEVNEMSSSMKTNSMSFSGSIGVGQKDSSGASQPQGRVDLQYRIHKFKTKLVRHKMLKLIQLSLVLYVILMTFLGGLRDPETGLIVDSDEEMTEKGIVVVNGDERPIAATNMFQFACLAVARISAFFMYPALVMVFVSKFRATISLVARSPLSIYFEVSETHNIHRYCGYTILIFSTSHSLAHLARWANQDNMYLLFQSATGLTGFLIMTSCLAICLPMMMFRDKVRYEIRKNLHYLFLLFAFALCFHTKPSAVPNGGFTVYVFSALLIWWFLDNLYCNFVLSEKIETPRFNVLSNSVQMTMKVSDSFQSRSSQGGYCYICLPWVDKSQWHAFSLFEQPSSPGERQIFIQKSGDWTKKVHDYLQRDTSRPAWIQGPYSSPYDSAEEYDNQVLVASGIGITPALSVIRAHKDTRRINLIWAVRDKELLEFILRHLYLDHKGWNLIFYTGKDALDGELEVYSNTNVCIVRGRPKLSTIVPNIIYGIETGKGLPERYAPEGKIDASEILAALIDDGDEEQSIATEAFQQVVAAAQESGYDLGIDKQRLSLASAREESLDTPSQHRRRRSTTIMQNLNLGFIPWEENTAAKRHVQTLCKTTVLKTWGILYCGGSKPMKKDLTVLSAEYNLDLHVESFSW